MPTYEERRVNALRSAGGDENSGLYQNWLSTYGPTGTASVVPHGDLAASTNLFNQGQVEDFYTRGLPGYAGMRQQQSDVIGGQLRGEVPQDVVNQIIQQAAERGITTGTAGAPNQNAALLRAIGLTSIGQQQTGMAGLDRAIGQTPVPELFAPQSLFVPERLAQQELDAYNQQLASERAYGNRQAQRQPQYGGGVSSVNLSGAGRAPAQYTSPLPWERQTAWSPSSQSVNWWDNPTTTASTSGAFGASTPSLNMFSGGNDFSWPSTSTTSQFSPYSMAYGSQPQQQQPQWGNQPTSRGQMYMGSQAGLSAGQQQPDWSNMSWDQLWSDFI